MSNIETLEEIWLAGILFFAGIVLLAWMDEKGWITYTGNVPTSHTLGNAFLELQGLVQPEKQRLTQLPQFEE